MFRAIFLIFTFAVLHCVAEKRYDGDQVLHMVPKNKEQVNFLSQFLHAPGEHFDFWKEPSAPGQRVDMRVDANMVPMFVRLLNSSNISYNVAISDVQKLIDEVNTRDRLALLKKGRANNRDIVGTFASTDDIYAWLESMCSTHSTMATCGTVGQSYEKRNINYIKLGVPGTNKKTIFLEVTIHAREWLGPATVVYIMDKMLTTYNSDPVVKRMMDTYDWLVVPITNPDGYEYSRNDERLWRKTRSKSSSFCYGADPNRNWDHLWSTTGSSSFPCSDTYHGTSAFSEVETRSMSEFITARKDEIKAYFAVHAYSQYWLIPYGAGPKPDDFDELNRVANIGAEALEAVNNKEWKVGNIIEIIYPAAGGSIDWVKSSAGVKYTYAFELRPANTALNGFIVDTSEIEPSGLEVWAGLVASIDAMQ